jgi:hypothetical protein
MLHVLQVVRLEEQSLVPVNVSGDFHDSVASRAYRLSPFMSFSA